MGSMDKIKSDDKLVNKWTKTYGGPYVVSDKLDGISCLFVKNGNETNLYTRGDGYVGQDISHLIKMVNMSITNLPNSKLVNVAIRGELIISKKNFKKYSKIMSNARNMAAGIVNAKPTSVNKNYAKDTDFVAYEIIESGLKPSTQLKPSAQLEQLEKWKLNVVTWDIYKDINLEILD